MLARSNYSNRSNGNDLQGDLKRIETFICKIATATIYCMGPIPEKIAKNVYSENATSYIRVDSYQLKSKKSLWEALLSSLVSKLDSRAVVPNFESSYDWNTQIYSGSFLNVKLIHLLLQIFHKVYFLSHTCVLPSTKIYVVTKLW